MISVRDNISDKVSVFLRRVARANWARKEG